MKNFGTRADYHKEKGKEMYGKDNCPFCDLSNQSDYIIWKGKNWFIIYNKFPYTGDGKHIMAIPYKHKKVFLEFDENELLELNEVHKIVKNFYGDESYFSFLRETLHKRSVEHIHFHFLPGLLKGKYIRQMLSDQGFPSID